MSENRKIIRLSAIYLVIILFISYAIPKEKNWMPSFSKDHAWPYGATVIRTVLPELFPEATISDNIKPIYNDLRKREGHSAIIIVDKFFDPDTLEVNSLLKYIGKGNDAFISASNFGYSLLDTLHLEYDKIYKTESIFSSGIQKSTYKTNFVTEGANRDSNFIFEMENGSAHIYNMDSLHTITGLTWIDQDTMYSFIRKKVGDGHLYLHTNPFLLTNFYMLTEEGKAYAESLFGHLSSDNIIWDEYYKEINEKYKSSPMNVVLQQPSLKWAYWLSIFAILVILLFLSKRKQRIIPVIESYKNDRVAFTKTISQLYFNNPDNRNIALKKINILREFLHQNYQMSNIKFTRDEIAYLVKRTTFKEEELLKLWDTIWKIQDSESVYDGRLKVLNRLINKIIQKS